LKEDLEGVGFHVWMDRHNIQWGGRWDDIVREAIKNEVYFQAFSLKKGLCKMVSNQYNFIVELLNGL